MWDFRILCAQVVPDHNTIARFRQSHPGGVADLFVQVLTLAAQAGLGRVGVVAVDGTKIAANASVGANRKSSWLREQVDQMIVAVEQADAAEDAMFVDGSGDRLQGGWADRAPRKQRIRAALARAEERAEDAGGPDQTKVRHWQDRVRVAERNAERARDQARERFDAYRAKEARAR